MSLATEVLLQRTRAEQVIPVYSNFKTRYPTASTLAKEDVHGLLGTIGSLGLRWRAPLMIKMAAIVAERGAPPESLAELAQLPGVGPYAAAAYLSFHRGRRAVIVDSNVVRWLGRVFSFETDGETRRKRWLIGLADDLTPKQSFRDYNYAVLDLAMKVCRARPLCHECPLANDVCRFAARARRPA